MKWPNEKKFAFTIFDDTDNCEIHNTKAVYEFLLDHKIYSTKSTWVYPSKNNYKGPGIIDEEYLRYINSLAQRGVEIALHGIGSGDYRRKDYIEGMEYFREKIGTFPKIQVNHSSNTENLYWGYKRFVKPFDLIYKLIDKKKYCGDERDTDYFWGDIAKKNIKYIRNLTFMGVDTLKYDPLMPYFVKGKNKYSNYWFSSSDGENRKVFNDLTSKKNIDLLEESGGLCIVYTHFAHGFIDDKGKLNSEFEDNIDYLSKKDCWFAPVSDILDYLLSQKTEEAVPSYDYLFRLNYLWLINKFKKKLYYNK